MEVRLNRNDDYRLNGKRVVAIVTEEMPEVQRPYTPLHDYDPLANHTYIKTCVGLCGLCSCLGLIGGIAYGIINSISNDLSKMHD